ncbi:DUF1822 family protein [Leptolyngbya sp. FACHB-261]|uniref:DUF1822 family protein n=1 Tax=Leptolyngbya sp. FACHB-261 TaxID=2692806 RepID=UPI001682A57B|nr:DUF1822 family protein [Leptolyngbya sp. FACHB-261]MBD2101794.1 DUF1822 family protein [Leptolyngbya sp. FACHB-261]
MTFGSALLEFADPGQLWLAVDPQVQTLAWQQSQLLVQDHSSWRAYLNALCLNTVLPWLQAEQDTAARVWPKPSALPSFWALVNGTAVNLGSSRLLLLPSEALDLSELRVPQEWVDIPNWAADYYLAVAIHPDEGWVNLWGYASHRQLKSQAIYDADDRSYHLAGNDLSRDLKVLWLSHHFRLAEPTQARLTPLPLLLQAQAETLLQQLSHPEQILPRLSLPFELWGALLSHGGWRQRLHERRQGLSDQWSVNQWLQSGISALAQQVGWTQAELQANRLGSQALEPGENPVLLVRQLTIAGEPYELRVLRQGSLEPRVWRFELRCQPPGNLIAKGVRLRLLTEDLLGFENHEDVADSARDLLYVEVALALGEALVWEVEPLPDDYDREILRL